MKLLLLSILFGNIIFANTRDELINIAKNDFNGLYNLFIYDILSYSEIEIDPEVKYEFSESKHDKNRLMSDLSYKLAKMDKINLSYQIYDELGIKINNWHDISQTENFEKLFNDGLYGIAFEYILKFNKPVVSNQNNNEKKFFTYLNRFLNSDSISNINEYLNQIDNADIDSYIKARILCSSVQLLGKDYIRKSLRSFFVHNKYEHYDLENTNTLIYILETTLDNIYDSKKKNTIKVNIGVLYSDIGDIDNSNRYFQELLTIESSRVNDYKIYMYVEKNNFDSAFKLAYDFWIQQYKNVNSAQQYKDILFEYLTYKMSKSDKEYYDLLKEIGERCTLLNIEQKGFKDHLNRLKVNNINSDNYAKSIKFILKQKRNSSDLLTNLFENCISKNNYKFASAIYDSSFGIRGMEIQRMSRMLLISDFQREDDIESKLISNISDYDTPEIVDTLLAINNISLVEKILIRTRNKKMKLRIINALINYYSSNKSEELLLKYLDKFGSTYMNISKYDNLSLDYVYKNAVDVSLKFHSLNQSDPKIISETLTLVQKRDTVWQHTVELMDYKDYYNSKEIKFYYYSGLDDITTLLELEGKCSKNMIEYYLKNEKVDEAYEYANKNSCSNNWEVLINELIKTDSTMYINQILQEKLILPFQTKIDDHKKYLSEFTTYSQTYNKDLDYYEKEDWINQYKKMAKNIEESINNITESGFNIIEYYQVLEDYEKATIILNNIINLRWVNVDFPFESYEEYKFELTYSNPNYLKYSFVDSYNFVLLNNEYYNKNIFYINEIDSTKFTTNKYYPGKNEINSYDMKKDNDLLAKYIQLYLWTVLDDTTKIIDGLLSSVVSVMYIKSNNYKNDFDKIMGDIDLSLFVRYNDYNKANLILFNAFQKILKLEDFDEMKDTIYSLSETLDSYNFNYSGISTDNINNFISILSN